MSVLVVVFTTATNYANADQRSRLSLEIAILSTDSNGDVDQRQCIATPVKPDWLLTAAHCIPSNNKAVEIKCGKHKAHVQTVRTHPTHDVVMIKVDSACAKSTPMFAISATNPGANNLLAQHPDNHSMLKLKIENYDSHVIRFKTSKACWLPGDSGTPIFISDINNKYKIIALLISGDPDCSNTQTAVRLQPISSWLVKGVGGI